MKTVSPASGSLAGGTTVTITGVGFGTKKENVNVNIGGMSIINHTRKKNPLNKL